MNDGERNALIEFVNKNNSLGERYIEVFKYIVATSDKPIQEVAESIVDLDMASEAIMLSHIFEGSVRDLYREELGIESDKKDFPENTSHKKRKPITAATASVEAIRNASSVFLRDFYYRDHQKDVSQELQLAVDLITTYFCENSGKDSSQKHSLHLDLERDFRQLYGDRVVNKVLSQLEKLPPEQTDVTLHSDADTEQTRQQLVQALEAQGADILTTPQSQSQADNLFLRTLRYVLTESR